MHQIALNLKKISVEAIRTKKDIDTLSTIQYETRSRIVVGWLSGQKQRTVNPPEFPTQVRILPPPPLN